MSPRRRRTQARFRIALGDNLELHLFAKSTTPTRVDNLNSIHSRTVLFDVNKDSQCQIRQFLQGGPPRMRTQNQTLYAREAGHQSDERGNAGGSVGKARHPSFRQNANVKRGFRYVDADKTASIGHEASPPYTRARSSLNGSTKPRKAQRVLLFYERKFRPARTNRFAHRHHGVAITPMTYEAGTS